MPAHPAGLTVDPGLAVELDPLDAMEREVDLGCVVAEYGKPAVEALLELA